MVCTLSEERGPSDVSAGQWGPGGGAWSPQRVQGKRQEEGGGLELPAETLSRLLVYLPQGPENPSVGT